MFINPATFLYYIVHIYVVFNVVIVCGLFEVEMNLCRVFFIIYLYMYGRWRSSYRKRNIVIPLTSVIPPHVCACPKPEPGFLTSNVMVLFMFIELRWEVIVRFVDIGRFVDRHCLNSPFHNINVLLQIQQGKDGVTFFQTTNEETNNLKLLHQYIRIHFF